MRLGHGSRLTGMATPSLSMVKVLSLSDYTVYVPVVHDSSLRLSSQTSFSKLSLHPMSGSVAPLFGRCTFRGGRSMYTWLGDCTSICIRSSRRNPPCTYFSSRFAIARFFPWSSGVAGCRPTRIVRRSCIHPMRGHQARPTFCVG